MSEEVIMQVPSFSADYPKAPIYVADLVRCGECIYWKNSLCQAWHRVIPKDGYCSIGERDRSTQTETQNSNLTFKTLEYCDICDHKGCEECIANALDEHCMPSQFNKQIEDECAKEYEELGLKELKELIEADRKTENSSEKPNNCDTCKWGEWYRQGYDITMMDDECGGCCSWNSKWTPKDEPQTDTEIAKAIVHKMIDDAVIAEDAYPDLRQRMHDAVERLDEYYPSEDERSE